MVLLCPLDSFRSVCALQELSGLASPHIQGITTSTNFYDFSVWLFEHGVRKNCKNEQRNYLSCWAGVDGSKLNKNVLVIVSSDIIVLIPFLSRLSLPVLWIQIGIHWIRIQHFKWIRIRFRFWIRFLIQGFDHQKLKKKKIQLEFFFLFLIKIAIYSSRSLL